MWVYTCVYPDAERRRKEALEPRSWCYRQFWAITWVLGTEPGSSATAVNTTTDSSLLPQLLCLAMATGSYFLWAPSGLEDGTRDICRAALSGEMIFLTQNQKWFLFTVSITFMHKQTKISCSENVPPSYISGLCSLGKNKIQVFKIHPVD